MVHIFIRLIHRRKSPYLDHTVDTHRSLSKLPFAPNPYLSRPLAAR